MGWPEVRRAGALVGALAVFAAAGAMSIGAVAARTAVGTPPAAPEASVAYPSLGLAEASGLAASVRHEGVIWVVEDSGEPVVHAYDRSGEPVASVLFRASDVFAGDNRDTESLAMGPGPTLWIADIGDNNAVRETVVVHTTPEPARLDDLVVTADSYRFRLPDGPRDAETLLVDPVDGRAYLITKSALGGALYAAPTDLVVGQTHELAYVQDVPGLLTGGDFSPDGSLVAVRTLGLLTTSVATIFDVVRDPDGGPLRLEPRAELVLPAQQQGESLAFTVDGRSLLVGSEGVDEPVWSVPIPADVLDAPAPSTPGPRSDVTASAGNEPSGAAQETAPETCAQSGWRSGWVTVALVGLAAALVGAIAVLRRR